MRVLTGAIAVLLLLGAAAVAQTLPAGRAHSEAFLAGELAGLWEAMTPELQQGFGSLAGLEAFRARVEDELGGEAELLDEAAESDGSLVIYTRTSRWSGHDGPVRMHWAMTEQGSIAGFSVAPVPELAASRFLDYRTRTALRLPFSGDWFVVWGGRTLAENYHAADRAQRFATDMLVLQEGTSHAGDAGRLDSYHCWGRPILAPADGSVAAVVGDLPDNPVGETDAANPAGNHVVIDFGNGEFGFLAHLQAGSVTVAKGDAVREGQQLGRCGNSGNTSEPHLHFHLQTTPDLATGEGLPAAFIDYVADGDPVARGEPRAGQSVRPGH